MGPLESKACKATTSGATESLGRASHISGETCHQHGVMRVSETPAVSSSRQHTSIRQDSSGPDEQLPSSKWICLCRLVNIRDDMRHEFVLQNRNSGT